MKVKLKDAFDLQIGRTPARSNAANWNGQYKWISITDLGNAGKYISTTKEKITDKGIDESGIKIVPKGTVVMSFKLSIGKTAITTEDMYTNEAIIAFNVRESIQVDSSYLYYLCCGTDWVEGTNKAVMGLTLNKATLSEKEIELPEIMIQREVAKKLDKLDKIIVQRKKQLQKLDELIQARFVELFGDPITNSFGWEEHWLDEYIEFLTSGSRGWAKYFTDVGNELFITIKNVKNNQITIDNIQYINAPNSKEAKRTRVKTGDLLISITADLGRTGVVDEAISKRGAYINQHLSLVRLDQSRINPLYVSYFLETEGGKKQFESKNQNGVKAGLNFEAIRSLKILVPPMELQEKYLTFVNQVNKSKVEIQQALEKTQLLFDSLMQQYFG